MHATRTLITNHHRAGRHCLKPGHRFYLGYQTMYKISRLFISNQILKYNLSSIIPRTVHCRVLHIFVDNRPQFNPNQFQGQMGPRVLGPRLDYGPRGGLAGSLGSLQGPSYNHPSNQPSYVQIQPGAFQNSGVLIQEKPSATDAEQSRPPVARESRRIAPWKFESISTWNSDGAVTGESGIIDARISPARFFARATDQSS